MVVLGIDIGTSKVAAVLLDAKGTLRGASSVPHHADLPAPPGRAEQSPDRILEAAIEAVQGLDRGLRNGVSAIGVTGQMHGVLLVDASGQPVVPLITWQDLRCEEDGILQDLRQRTGYALSTGFGSATLAYLEAHQRMPGSVTSSGTIADWFVSQLCGQSRCGIDPTQAAGWGLFDLVSLQWDMQAVEKAGIRSGLLPAVVPCSSVAGQVCEAMAHRLAVPANTPVAVALGDNQASLLATLAQPEQELGLTLGTGGQLSAVMPAGWRPVPACGRQRFEYRPYVGSRYVAVASALCGGSAWQWLAASVEGWLGDLGIPSPKRDDLYARLDQLGLASQRQLDIRPHFIGERYEPSLRGSISGIDMEDLSLGDLAAGLAYGIVRNLAAMLPEEVLRGRSRVLASGNALRRSPLLRRAATEVLGAELVMTTQQEEAACGAAKNALLMLQ